LQRFYAAGLLDLNGFHGDVPASQIGKGTGTMAQPNFVAEEWPLVGPCLSLTKAAVQEWVEYRRRLLTTHEPR